MPQPSQRSGNAAIKPLMDLGAYLKGKDSLLDAETVQQELFPTVKADVFLSHASGDSQQVMQLAVLLENLGLKVFVDSCVWGNVYELLEEVDDQFSIKDRQPRLYHYHKVTRTSANVYMILNAALQRMIDGCELFLYLDSAAVRIQDYVDSSDYIGSPWVFSELMFARTVARRPRPRPRPALEALTQDKALARTQDSIARFRAPASSHTLEWKVLQRAISDNTGLPTSARWQEHSPFLDHLYGKLTLTDHERYLLGWQDAG